MCDHENRERLLVIRHGGRVKAEMWMCHDCGEYIGTKPMSVREFLSENPAPCMEAHGVGGERQHGPDDSDTVNTLLSRMAI